MDEKRRKNGTISSPRNTLNEIKELTSQLDTEISGLISNQNKIPLESLVRIPAQIWYKSHMNGDRHKDNKW